MQNVIETTNLVKTFTLGEAVVRALDGVSLAIQRGEKVAITGPSGSGKSTLVQHLNGLIKPTSGEVLVDGQSLSDKATDLRALRRKVGLVFQYPEYQLFEETVEKDVGYGPRNLGLPDAEVKIRVAEALSQVGIPEELFQKSPFELSGGQKRRVAIAGVLAMRPSTLVLDEPVAGLDPAGREELLKLIQDIHEGGVTVIMVTHSMDDAARLCGRLVVLNRGSVAFDATPAEVFRHGDELVGMGLDVPECVKLVKKLNTCGFHLPDGLFRIEDVKRAILKEVRGC